MVGGVGSWEWSNGQKIDKNPEDSMVYFQIVNIITGMRFIRY